MIVGTRWGGADGQLKQVWGRDGNSEQRKEKTRWTGESVMEEYIGWGVGSMKLANCIFPPFGCKITIRNIVFQFVFGLFIAMEKAEDRQLGVKVRRRVKMACKRSFKAHQYNGEELTQCCGAK